VERAHNLSKVGTRAVFFFYVQNFGGGLKLQEWKMREWKYRHDNVGVENVRV